MTPPETALVNFSAVVITGGSSGIGKSFIELIGKHCPEIEICNLSRREPVIKIDGLRLRHIPCDLGDAAQLAAALARIDAFLSEKAPRGRVLLINNSGFGLYGSFPEPSLSENLAMLDLNIRALVHLTGALLPRLKERGGAVMNISSVAAFQATPYMGAYAATKAFVLNYSLALNEELRGSGVSVLAVCPGPTSTQFFERAGLKEGSVPDAMGQTSEQVVRASLAALAAGKAFVVSGWKNKLMTLAASLPPRALVARLAAVVLRRFRMRQVRR